MLFIFVFVFPSLKRSAVSRGSVMLLSESIVGMLLILRDHLTHAISRRLESYDDVPCW